MRYRMKQKLLSLGQDFTIGDEEGNAVYKVGGRAISFAASIGSHVVIDHLCNSDESQDND